MTVLKNPAGSPTVEVAALEASGRSEPQEAAPPSAGSGGRSLPSLRTGACFGLTLLVFLLGVALANMGAPEGVYGLAFTAAAVMLGLSILLALARAVIGLVEVVTAIRARSELDFMTELAGVLGNLFMAGLGMFVAYLGTVGFSRGRQLRRRGRVLLPELRENAEWTDLRMGLEAEAVPDGLPDQWRENGRTEHASVAAFARLTLDLMALGAPPRLIAAANQDALDEIRHAELCFSLATALDGKRMSPAPFPVAQRVATLPRSRPLALARLAVSSLVDGALHEGVSARIIAQLARRCASPAIAGMLKSIAADEGRHSAHGWAVVEWCVEQGGAGVRAALLGALRALPPRMRTILPEPAAEGAWERWGIHGHELEGEEYVRALAHLDARVRALVVGRSRRAA